MIIYLLIGCIIAAGMFIAMMKDGDLQMFQDEFGPNAFPCLIIAIAGEVILWPIILITVACMILTDL